MEDNIQNVENQEASNSQASENKDSSINTEKLESIINKGLKKKENAILHSYFEQMGMTEEEMNSAIDSFKKSKEEAAQNSSKAYEESQANLSKALKELEEKEALLKEKELDYSINLMLMKEGVNNDQIPYILKLIDKTDLQKEDGTIDEEKFKANLENIYKAFSLTKKEETKLIKVGADTPDKKTDSQDAFIRKLCGLD